MTNLKGYKDIPIGGMITEAGNSENIRQEIGEASNLFGTKKVAFTASCAGSSVSDTAIIVEDGKMKGINYDHCKGCGICAGSACAKKALYMVKEE